MGARAAGKIGSIEIVPNRKIMLARSHVSPSIAAVLALGLTVALISMMALLPAWAAPLASIPAPTVHLPRFDASETGEAAAAAWGDANRDGYLVRPVTLTRAVGLETRAYLPLIITLRVNLQPLPPPYNVRGIDSPAAPMTITWEYGVADLSKIVGFRVYRYAVSENAPEATFDVPASTQQYVDTTVTPTCSKMYYVVALYIDSNGKIQESASSSNAWYTPPCS